MTELPPDMSGDPQEDIPPESDGRFPESRRVTLDVNRSKGPLTDRANPVTPFRGLVAATYRFEAWKLGTNLSGWNGTPSRGMRELAYGFEVLSGFPFATERLLAHLAPTVFERVSSWPELRGVRASIRIYRLASADERDLDLVRIELRIPGIERVGRFTLWRKLRTEVETSIEHQAATASTLQERRIAREIRDTVSTSLVG